MNKLVLVFIFMLAFTFNACDKEAMPKMAPKVETTGVSNISPNSATAIGKILSDGNDPVSIRGFVIALLADPTIADTKVQAGSGNGTFSASLESLEPGKTYHLRAFATNSKGTSYGEELIFNTLNSVPVVTTSNPSSISAIAVLIGGEVIYDGGSPITSRGFCWNTTGNPTITDFKSSNGIGAGSFNSTINNLKYSSKIYVRAYATNDLGTAYGNQIEAKTLSLIPSGGLVGWWPFNSNANDESGNGFNGSVSGAVSVADRFTLANAAYLFNGSSDLIRIDHHPAFNFAASNLFSVSYWINAAALSSVLNSVIMEKQANYGNAQQGWNTSIEPNGRTNFYVHNASGGLTACDYGEILTDRWYHIVQIWNNGTASVYINGALAGSSTFNDIAGDNSESFLIGKNDFGAPGFNGKIDDVAIWNRALTSTEIQKIYNGSGF